MNREDSIAQDKSARAGSEESPRTRVHKRMLPRYCALALAVWFGHGPTARAADAITILHTFTVQAQGGTNSCSTLTLAGSKLYGINRAGGTANHGIIFSVNTDGSGFTVLHNFTGGDNDGKDPYGPLTLAGTKLYGMTPLGGPADNGVLFSINTDGSGFTILHSFLGRTNDGSRPTYAPTLSDSKIYGATTVGGASDLGTVFSANLDGSDFRVLYSFKREMDGASPRGTLILAGSQLYGTASLGGARDSGTIFRIGADGSNFSVLHTFAHDEGAEPESALTLAGSRLFGMAYLGGANNEGSIFALNTDGTGFQLLHSFSADANDGRQSYGGLILMGSRLYGKTYLGGGRDMGTLFSIGTDGAGFRLLKSFTGSPADGSHPKADLTVSSDSSTLYGTTADGGSADDGIVFSFPIGTAP